MKIEKYAIEFFDTRALNHGGHGHFIAKLFNNQLQYLRIDFCKWKTGVMREYYDGWHVFFYFGFIVLSYAK